jgi:lysophospholipase L1-like esterase
LAGFLCALGGLFFLLAALCDVRMVAPLHVRQPLSSEATIETARSRTVFAAAGLLLVTLGFGARRAFLSPRCARWLVAGLSCAIPLLILERGSRPFVERLTTLFERDAELGWRNRPLADDTYWGARVRINSAGLRGPERALAKPFGVRRVLVLGDSVAFGLLLEDDRETFPAQLERELAERTGTTIECLNASVCGWSTRQERLFLEREGEHWQPDLVVLAFVLNDVTERLGMAQLAYARPDGMPAWLAESGIYLTLREWRLLRTLGGDSPAARAHARRLTPYHVILQSDSDPVQAAWKEILGELEGLLDACERKRIPLALVVFPFTIQLREPKNDAPQWILTRFAGRRALACLDLLPTLAAAQRERRLAENELFFDGLHPTAIGHSIAAAETARFLVEQGFFPR